MPRFAKQSDCPASATLLSYGASTLSFLARPAVSAHLAACEFCDAEIALLTQATRTTDDARTHEVEPPPAMPLALRLFAESALADISAALNATKRAA